MAAAGRRDEIVKEIGGLAGLPAYQVTAALMSYGLTHENVKIPAGDLHDAYIAAVAPYCAVSVLDRATAHRIREARLPCAPRVTARLANVPGVVSAVRQGNLISEPSV